ncbi:hypothetical protein [Amycolatopsis palatopharyngis]|uniref:hypothetical protein n=1 Tax=Amycolatopsis palatopharyngis TaxID=187982 RepID=UPI000E23F00B|nr:hypothetical protein [Amycolatopsis palatopharyngis]
MDVDSVVRGANRWSKGRIVRLAILAVVAGVLGGYVVSVEVQGYPDVRLPVLLAPWPEPLAAEGRWTVDSDMGEPRIRIAWSTGSVERVWSRDPSIGDARTGTVFNSDPQIAQAVYRFSSSLVADIRYWLAQPSHRTDYPAFAYPDEAYQSAVADRSQTVCATGSLEKCQIWFYWARYGQFIVQLHYINTDWASTAEFRQYVEHIDQYVGARLVALSDNT